MGSAAGQKAIQPTQTSTLPRSLPWAVRYGLWIVIIPALASLGWTISESTPMTRGTVVSIAFDFAMIVIAFVLNEQSRRIIQNTETVNLLQKMSETVGALGQQHLILLRIVENIVAKQVVDTKQKKRK
jgi:hypothetical protein